MIILHCSNDMKKKYWVVWAKNLQKWQVKKTGSKVALKNFDLKSEAIVYAMDMAKRNAPSQLIVKKKDGTKEELRNY